MAAEGDTQVRSRVCRRLFADPEDQPQGNDLGIIDNFHNHILDQIRLDQEAAKLKWNFDFSTETPLEGKWQWVKVEEPLPEAPADEGVRAPPVVCEDKPKVVQEPQGEIGAVDLLH